MVWSSARSIDTLCLLVSGASVSRGLPDLLYWHLFCCISDRCRIRLCQNCCYCCYCFDCCSYYCSCCCSLFFEFLLLLLFRLLLMLLFWLLLLCLLCSCCFICASEIVYSATFLFCMIPITIASLRLNFVGLPRLFTV